MQLIYTMFISNNRASFDLWSSENLVKHQKVSKYYENGCSPINFDISIGITFYFALNEIHKVTQISLTNM